MCHTQVALPLVNTSIVLVVFAHNRIFGHLNRVRKPYPRTISGKAPVRQAEVGRFNFGLCC